MKLLVVTRQQVSRTPCTLDLIIRIRCRQAANGKAYLYGTGSLSASYNMIRNSTPDTFMKLLVVTRPQMSRTPCTLDLIIRIRCRQAANGKAYLYGTRSLSASYSIIRNSAPDTFMKLLIVTRPQMSRTPCTLDLIIRIRCR